MKLTYKKDHGRLGRKGESFDVRDEAQGQYFIDNGIAEKAGKESKDNTDETTTPAAPETMTTTNTIEPAKKVKK
jgi:ribosomal protein L9